MTTASGLLTYVTPLTPADALSGGRLYPTSLGSRSLWTTKNNPYTSNKIEGWKFDSRIWPDDNIENINAFVPSIWDPTISGITETYFQSGMGDGDDLRIAALQYILSSGLQTTGTGNLWAPQIHHGYYYDYDEEGYLFSDDSMVVYPSYSGVLAGLNSSVTAGLNFVYLPEFPKVGSPLLARTFTWDEDNAKYSVYKEYRKKVNFTGRRQIDYSRLETYDTARNAILFENIDNSEPECIISYSGFAASGVMPAVIFNKQCCEPIGTITASGLPTFTTLDSLGYAEGESQQLHFTYAPVDLTSPVRIFSWNQSTTSGITNYREWTPVPSGTNFRGNQVLLDGDLGTIQFGTTASGQNLPNVGDNVGAHYYPTVQIEFEPENTDDFILAPEANLNPIYRRTGRGFVYLSTRVSDSATVTLAADLALISTNKYGPLAIGSNFCPVIATVKDRKGNVLEGIPVDIFITSEPHAGTFGATDEAVTAITDEYGEARAFYNPPRTINEIGENIESTGWSNNAAPAYPDYPAVTNATILTTSNLLVEASDPPDDVYVYGVYTDDPLLGLTYAGIDPADTAAQLAEYYKRYLIAEDIYGPTGMIPSGVVSTVAINWEDGHRLIWNLARPVAYENNAGLGRRMLLSEFDSDALNPHNPTVAGAWVPKQPFKVENVGVGIYRIIFDTTSVAIPVPAGDLVSYFVVAPTSVKLQASVYNARLNKTIYSNEIQIKLEIPDYMNGLWLIEGVNSMNIGEISSLITSAMEGKKLPLGFRLRSSSVTLAAALNGVTFLDINSTDDPEVSVWPTVGFTFNISSIV
jgi:hypothetical protein